MFRVTTFFANPSNLQAEIDKEVLMLQEKECVIISVTCSISQGSGISQINVLVTINYDEPEHEEMASIEFTPSAELTAKVQEGQDEREG